MTKCCKITALLLICLIALSRIPAQSVVASLPAKNRLLVLISLDGFPAYDLDDPKLPIPTLREFMETGSWARRMQPVNPTVTWPNHTSLVTGLLPRDHGLLYNGTLVHTDQPFSFKVDPTVEKERMVHCPTLYDIAHQTGLTTAQVDWVAINAASSIDWAFPERARATDPLVQEMIAKGVIRTEDVGNEGNPTILWRDQIWTKAGAYIIREHKPNLLLFHLLALDTTHHNYGPRTLASYGAIAFLDSCVRRLRDAVQDAGMLDRTTFVVVSDHGFKKVEKQIRLKTLLANTNWNANVQAMPEGGSAMIYVKPEHRAELIPKIQELFSQTEGVQSVVTESQFSSLGLPVPERDRQMADVVAYAKTGYAFVGGMEEGGPAVAPVAQSGGSHGYLNTDPEMDAIFIATGYGVRRGVVIERIRNLSVAPTLAKLLGIQLPRTEAPALDKILQ